MSREKKSMNQKIKFITIRLGLDIYLHVDLNLQIFNSANRGFLYFVMMKISFWDIRGQNWTVEQNPYGRSS